jgi:hypothetical protein
MHMRPSSSARGEVTRINLDTLRIAKTGPVTLRGIALKAMPVVVLFRKTQA